MKALKWLERARSAVDPFIAMSEVWQAFNKIFSVSAGKTEREKIVSFIGQHLSAEEAQGALASCSKDIAYLMSKPVIDMRGNGRDTSENINAFNVGTDSNRKLSELCLVAYQVRCNLVHGEKSPDRVRDAELCRHSASIIADVVERCALKK